MRQLEAKVPAPPADDPFSLRAGRQLEKSGHFFLAIDCGSSQERDLAAGIQASQCERGRLAVEVVMASSAERARQFSVRMHLARLITSKDLPSGYGVEATSVQHQLPTVLLVVPLEPLPDTGRIRPRRPFIAGLTSDDVELGELPEREESGLVRNQKQLAKARVLVEA